LKPGQPAADR